MSIITEGLVNDLGSGFSPADIAGLVLWLDAQVGLFDATVGGSAVTADGATVARWEDQSGGGRHATQATGGSRPTLQTAEVGGQSVLRFAGSQTIGGAITVITEDATVFIVGVLPNTSNAAFLDVTATGSTNTGVMLFREASGTNFRFRAGDGDATCLFSYSATTPALFSARRSGPTLRELWLRGVFQDAATTSVAMPDSINYQLGSLFGGIYPLTGDIAEVVLYNVALSDLEREAVEAYLIAKYSL